MTTQILSHMRTCTSKDLSKTAGCQVSDWIRDRFLPTQYRWVTDGRTNDANVCWTLISRVIEHLRLNHSYSDIQYMHTCK